MPTHSTNFKLFHKMDINLLHMSDDPNPLLLKTGVSDTVPLREITSLVPWNYWSCWMENSV